MNSIGSLLGIPHFGWNHGQSRLFEHGDVRLIWLLRRIAVRAVAERVAANLARAGQISGGDVMLTVVTAARENSSSLSDVSMSPIETWHQGGLDFLGAEIHRLGLPTSITEAWRRRTFISKETGHRVTPAIIPARDQVLAYAAQLRASYTHNFRSHLNAILGAGADDTLAQSSRIGTLAWKAYSFLAPGGADYDPRKSVAAQSGQHFGSKTALLFLQHRAESQDSRLDLDDILTVAELNSVEWVRSSKVRVAEALFLERMWTVTRELLPPSRFDMTAVLTGFLLAAGIAAIPPRATPHPEGWEKLYQSQSKKTWISAVWLARDGSWRAAGPGFIVSGGPGPVKTTDLGDDYVTSFGEDMTGVVMAVGGNQAIWEEKDGAFQRVHERAGPARKGRAAHEDVLDGIGYFDPEAPDRLVAYGTLHLSLSRDPEGTWKPSNNESAAKVGTLGTDIHPPSGCHIAGWHWIDRATAMFECHEGLAFLYKKGTTLAALGRLPKPCQASLIGVTARDDEVFVACGDPAGIWRTGIKEAAWSRLPGVRDVTALKARDRCLLVGTRTAVVRRCD